MVDFKTNLDKFSGWLHDAVEECNSLHIMTVHTVRGHIHFPGSILGGFQFFLCDFDSAGGVRTRKAIVYS